MRTYSIDVIDPNAETMLSALAKMNLIKIKAKSEFLTLLNRFRAKEKTAPSLEEITKEVEEVRSESYNNNA